MVGQNASDKDRREREREREREGERDRQDYLSFTHSSINQSTWITSYPNPRKRPFCLYVPVQTLNWEDYSKRRPQQLIFSDPDGSSSIHPSKKKCDSPSKATDSTIQVLASSRVELLGLRQKNSWACLSSPLRDYIPSICPPFKQHWCWDRPESLCLLVGL